MSQHKLLEIVELQKELKQLKAELDTADPLKAKEIQERMLKTKDLLNELDTQKEESKEEVLEKLKKGIHDLKNEIHNKIYNSPEDDVQDLLIRLQAQHQESKGKEISRKSRQFLAKHPLFKERYTNKDTKKEIQPTNLKHSKKIERVLVNFLEIYEKNKTENIKASAKECLSAAISIEVIRYNKKHETRYSNEKFKHEFLSEVPIKYVIEQIEGPEPQLLYKLNRQLTHITDKLAKSPLAGGYDQGIRPTKTEQKQFLTSIIQMYEENKPNMSLKHCKVAIVSHFRSQFVEQSNYDEYKDKIIDANNRMDKILESKGISKLMMEIDEIPKTLSNKSQSEITERPGDYSSLGSDSTSVTDNLRRKK